MNINRLAERARTARDELDEILDAGWVGTLSVSVDGSPQVVPILYARVGDAVILHGSTGAGSLRAAAAGSPVAFCVAHLDGFVYAASLFESSANYRSAVVYGNCERLTGDAAEAALVGLSEHVMPGRAGEVRANTAKERAATIVLRLPIVDGQWLAKARTGSASVEEGDDPSVWTGVLPVRTVFGLPQPSPETAERGIPVAGSVARRVADHAAEGERARQRDRAVVRRPFLPLEREAAQRSAQGSASGLAASRSRAGSSRGRRSFGCSARYQGSASGLASCRGG